ncbi:MAG: hypothetical protein GW761_08825 [Leptospira sp.]|nr:hypothetical protein [Leptospira sp.]
MKLKFWYNFVVILALFMSIILFPQLPLNDLTFYLRLTMIFILIIEIILVFRNFLLNSENNNLIKNIGVSIVSTLVFLLLIESSFMFVPRTNGINSVKDRFSNIVKENISKKDNIVFLQEIDLSKKLYIDKIGSYLTNNNVNYIDLSILFNDLPISDPVINSNDAHPSKKVHSLVDSKLSKYISKELSSENNE